MKYPTLVVIGLLGAAVAATTAGERILHFESKNFTGDLRNGPYTFLGSTGTPVRASVSNLKVESQSAVLKAPAGVAMATAEGKRSAEFTGSVQVLRNRLVAKGPSLTYSEETGYGTLKGPASMTFTPADSTAAPVTVQANSMSFDVDNNTSISKGDVKLVNGKQSAQSENLTFNETTELAILTGKRVTLERQAAKAGDSAIVIEGKEARINTGKDKKLMLITGKIKLVDGNITTTGDTLYYDDKQNLAIVVGSPAKSFDSKSKTTISGGTLEQRTDLNRVRQLAKGYKIPTELFK